MAGRETWHLRGGFWATSIGTLVSRVLGLLRDMATAALLGLGEGGVMDAFVVAFRVPNLLRRIFGEGALAASFLPVFSSEIELSPRRAWQLFSVMLAWLTIVLTAVTLLAEAGCAVWWWARGDSPATAQLIGLLAAMLPYMVFVCLAAQASAALQALLEFRVPAIAPALLNVCWLAAAWGVAPYFAPDKQAQALTLAVAVVVSGVLQFGVQLPALRRKGFRFEYDWAASREAFWLIVGTMLPVTLGLAVTQLNTLADSLIAWGLSSEVSRPIAWLGGGVVYPLRTGAAAAVYFGERFYQLPVGILGVAIATVIYPMLTRDAARGDRAAVGAQLSLGLRLVVFTALPAGIGIMLVAEPLARVLFERGEFTAHDAARAARMIACYASGVWAYCAIPVLVRGFYALGNRRAPVTLGLVAVAINLVLNLALIWPLAEAGLAVSSAIAAGVQAMLLALTFSSAASPLDWRALAATITRSALASGAMIAVVLAVQHIYLVDAASSHARLAVQLTLAIGLGIGTYLAVAKLLRASELNLLFARPSRDADQQERAG